MSAQFPWTADSNQVTADSPNYTASGSYSPQFPNVPPLPGVPPLNRLGTAAQVSAASTLAGETQALASQLGLPATVVFGASPLYSGLSLQPLDPSYGIFSSERVWAVLPDSVVELDFSADSGIMTHPIEQGAFAAYNRVQEPISIRLLLCCQGVNTPRTKFLTLLEGLREGTELVTIATPDTAYPNMALKSYGYKKTAERGAVTIWADTQWMEGRSTNVSVSAPATSQPQGAATTSVGALQPQTPTSAQQAAIASAAIVPVSLPLDIATEMPPSGDAF